jgi:hypothetical protein
MNFSFDVAFAQRSMRKFLLDTDVDRVVVRIFVSVSKDADEETRCAPKNAREHFHGLVRISALLTHKVD